MIKLPSGEPPVSFPGPSGPTTVIAVVFRGDEATVDNGALHARSKVETGVRFTQDEAARGRGERVHVVWVASATDRFLGACSAEMWIDRATNQGWKRVSDLVNRMSSAVTGKIDLDLSDVQRRSLGELLARLDPAAWERSSALRGALAT